MVEKYTVDELLSLNNKDAILSSRASDLSRKSFCHYTTVDKAKLILSPKEDGNYYMFASNLLDMNDENESKLHREHSLYVHSLCFCNTRHEKIPLWYLYSGICGKGASIRFTPGDFLKFLKSIKTVFPVDENFNCDFTNPIEIDNVNFELQLGWVYYVMQGNNRVIYRNEICDVEEISEEIKKTCYFVKDYPWEYECEFRLIVINKTDTVYSKLAFRIPKEIVQKLRIRFAPEITNFDALKKEFEDFGILGNNIRNSELKIKMNLLERNKTDLIEAIPEILNVKELETIYKAIKEKLELSKDGLK